MLMGYYNPIYVYPREVPRDAIAAGVDGLIVVDLPPEADDELCLPAIEAGAKLHPPRNADDRRQAAAGRAAQHLGLPLLRVDHRHYRHRRARCKRRSRRTFGGLKGDSPSRSGRFWRKNSRPGEGAGRGRRRRRRRLGPGSAIAESLAPKGAPLARRSRLS